MSQRCGRWVWWSALSPHLVSQDSRLLGPRTLNHTIVCVHLPTSTLREAGIHILLLSVTSSKENWLFFCNVREHDFLLTRGEVWCYKICLLLFSTAGMGVGEGFTGSAHRKQSWLLQRVPVLSLCPFCWLVSRSHE